MFYISDTAGSVRPDAEVKFMIQGKWFSPGSDLSELLPVRSSVFSQGLDDLDSLSWNVLVYQDSVPVATGRIWWNEGAYFIGDICVLEAFRRQRLGDLVLRLLLYKAQSHAAKEVRLSCPRELTGFFSRLGLRELSGPDATVVEMMIPGESIDLDTCKNCPRSSCPDRK